MAVGVQRTITALYGWCRINLTAELCYLHFKGEAVHRAMNHSGEYCDEAP